MIILALDLGKFNPLGRYFDIETRKAEYTPALTDRKLWFLVHESERRIAQMDGHWILLIVE